MASEEVTARFSRRTLLKSGLVGVVLLSAGAGALALRRPKPGSAKNLAVLSPEEHAILAAVAERICPALGPGAPGATALDVASAADHMFANADKDAQEGFKMALNAFDNALTGALFGERTSRFTSLSPEEQERELLHWRDSRIGFRRTVFHALNSLVAAIYFDQPETWERIGYPGPPSPSGLRLAYAENLVDLNALRAKEPPRGN